MRDSLSTRPNAGRKADWFREACADIIHQEKLIEFVGRVASGKEMEGKVVVKKSGEHEIVSVPVDAYTRLAAFKMLAEWGVGKPVQMVINVGTTPEESKLKVEQMLQLVQTAMARPQITKATPVLTQGNGGNGANGHH